MSQVSRIVFSNVRLTDWVSEWQGHLLSCSGQLKMCPQKCAIFFNFDNFRQFYIFFKLWTTLTIQTIAFTVLTIEKTILETCDIWDTDYNTDNWEPGFMTIIVTWQLIVTLDSIRNSCDVFYNFYNFWQLTTIFTIQTIAFAILTIEKTILETCDIWDTDYNSDNWESEFMTIFVIWQSIVTLDSNCNSCVVWERKNVSCFWK